MLLVPSGKLWNIDEPGFCFSPLYPIKDKVHETLSARKSEMKCFLYSTGEDKLISTVVVIAKPLC